MTSILRTRPRWLVLLALAMVALNLRIALSSVSALVGDIRDATGWSATVIGTLSMIPVLCMGLFALVVPRIAARIGRRRTVGLALALLTIALVSRLWAEVPGVLHLSALAAGISIAMAGGLVPSIVREQLPQSVGRATGLWTGVMLAGATLGGALTVPIADALGSWPKALAFWAIPAAIGLITWTVIEGRRHDATDGAPNPVRIRELPWRNRTAWALTAYLVLNSIIFYTCLAWLAASYVERGWDRAGAGLMLGVFTASEIVAALLMPAIAEHTKARRVVYAVTLACVVVPTSVIGWFPDFLPVVVVTIQGAALGGGFAMGLALLSEYGATPASSARLTAMAFSVTYVCAAMGPLIAGAIIDHVDSWPLIFSLLALAAVAQFATIPALRRGVHIN